MQKRKKHKGLLVALSIIGVFIITIVGGVGIYSHFGGFGTGECADTTEFTKYANLILLDLMLPGLSGEELLPQLQGIPVIVVSAKVTVQDKVNLLLGGAADYLTKPFDTKELLARIAVRLREAALFPFVTVLSCGELTLNTSSHGVFISGLPVSLTRTEYAILKLLMQNSGQVLAKSVLLDRISEDTPDCTENSLKTHISNLRGKLRDVAGKDYIEAVWGIGFRLSAGS